MKRSSAFLVAAACLGWAALPVAADAGSGFDARRDAEKVSDCLRAYKILEEAALGLKPEVFQAYETAHIVRWKRILPFADASARAVGDYQFYRRASAFHRAAETLLASNAIEVEGVRDSLVLSLAAEAKACDELVIGWGPPPNDPAEGQ